MTAAFFRTLYVFIVMEIGSRQILHHNVTGPSYSGMAAAAVPGSAAGDHPYRFVIHDRDRIFSADVDKSLTNLRVQVLRTPVRAPKANSVCERLGGSLRPGMSRLLDSIPPTPSAHDDSGLDHAL